MVARTGHAWAVSPRMDGSGYRAKTAAFKMTPVSLRRTVIPAQMPTCSSGLNSKLNDASSILNSPRRPGWRPQLCRRADLHLQGVRQWRAMPSILPNSPKGACGKRHARQDGIIHGLTEDRAGWQGAEKRPKPQAAIRTSGSGKSHRTRNIRSAHLCGQVLYRPANAKIDSGPSSTRAISVS